ncbi:MAG: VanZ family protein [Prevotella sp.]|nr:VanZ family protein [Prevotella sp.]
MKLLIKTVKNFPLSSLLIVAIWTICIIPIPETPLSHVSMADKWTHMVMYFVLTMCVGFEMVRNKQTSTKQLLLYAWLMPIIMGGLIELVQANCTGGRRSGEWLDFYADAFGSTIAFLIGILLVRCRAKH